MDRNLSKVMIESIRKVEFAFIHSKFNLISKENNHGRLPVKEIQTILSNYLKNGESITSAPEEYIQSLKIILINNSKVPTWHIDYDLWINHTQSDLTMSISIFKLKNSIHTSLEDLHVL
jgi:hypothetical protein